MTEYRDILSGFAGLLDIAINDYLLIVALDSSLDEHLLSYESPLHVASLETPKRIFSEFLRGIGGVYRVDYTSQVPSSLRAYHLVAETEDGVYIDNLFLTTDAERALSEKVAADLTRLADSFEKEKRLPHREKSMKILELEVQSALQVVSELVRRREWEGALADQPMDAKQLSDARQLAGVAASGEATKDANDKTRSSLLHHPSVTPEVMRRASRQLGTAEISVDISVATEPSSMRTHAYWRRIGGTNVSRPITIVCRMALRDSSGARPRSVILYVLGVALISWITACFLAKDVWPLRGDPVDKVQNADAIVAVLLLVPGFLYTRLDLPSRGSIASRLRFASRLAAELSIGASALLGAAIATGLEGAWLRGAFAVAILLPLGLVLLLLRKSRDVDGPLDFAELDPPKWLQRNDRSKVARPDAVFASSELLVQHG